MSEVWHIEYYTNGKWHLIYICTNAKQAFKLAAWFGELSRVVCVYSSGNRVICAHGPWIKSSVGQR
jgi:hypothetical protein